MASDKAILIVPQALDIHYVNGDKYKSSLFSLGNKELELEVGPQHIVVEYDTIWELDSDNHERVTSDPLHLTFQLTSGGTYQVKLPAIIEVEEAEEFIESPKLSLIDRKSGQEVAIRVAFQPPVMAVHTPMSDEGSEQQALEQLRFWWSKATQSQRERFMAEIISGAK